MLTSVFPQCEYTVSTCELYSKYTIKRSCVPVYADVVDLSKYGKLMALKKVSRFVFLHHSCHS